MKNTIGIADDHPLLLNGLKLCLQEAGYEVVFAAQDGKEAFALIQQYQPGLVLLDIKMPGLNGAQVAKNCRTLRLPTKVILLSYYLEPGLLPRAREMNISGYVLKENGGEIILEAVASVLAGNTYFDAQIESALQEKVNPLLEILRTLSPTERKVLMLIARGSSTKDIAAQAFVSIRTIDKHRENISKKIGSEVLNGRSIAEWAKEYRQLILAK